MSEKITISLTVHGDEFDALYFKKQAPKLPEGITWHDGLMIEIVEKEEWIFVDHVVLNLDGSVKVSADFEMPGAGWGEMVKSSWWESRGWIPSEKD